MPAPSTLHVSLTRLADNVHAWRGFLDATAPTSTSAAAQPPRLCAVVKADAYGLGAVAVCRRLATLPVDMLAVYSIQQACELLAADIATPLLVLMPTHHYPMQEPLLDAARAGRVQVSIDASDTLLAAHRFATQLDTVIPIHLHLDTGMSRAGLNAVQFGAVLAQVASLKGVRIAGVYTHFASPDIDPATIDQQLAIFDSIIEPHRHTLPPDTLFHTAGTFAALRHRGTHRDMVRVGLGLFGHGPAMLDDAVAQPPPVVQPVLRWTSHIIHLQRVPAGRTVGYRRTTTLTRDSILGIVPAGYGDGYPVSLSRLAAVQFADGTCAPQLGAVNMDQIVIDLTDHPHAAVGDTVTLISDDPDSPCSVPALARLAGTNSYEILCRLSTRLPRVYTDAPASRASSTSASTSAPAPRRAGLSRHIPSPNTT